MGHSNTEVEVGSNFVSCRTVISDSMVSLPLTNMLTVMFCRFQSFYFIVAAFSITVASWYSCFLVFFHVHADLDRTFQLNNSIGKYDPGQRGHVQQRLMIVLICD